MIKLMRGDCLVMMETLPNKSIDFCLTDPPYGTTACKWDSVIPFEPMWKQINRIVKPNGVVALFGGNPFQASLIMSNPKNFKYEWIWIKHKPSNFVLAKKQPMKYHESISIFYTKQCLYNPIMKERLSDRVKNHQKNEYKGFNTHTNELAKIKNQNEKDFKNYNSDKKLPSNHIEFSCVTSNSKDKVAHPTQKPVPLLEYLINTYTLEGETVLDFTMGSGSTGVACKNLNRKFIGIEKDLVYFKLAESRIL